LASHAHYVKRPYRAELTWLLDPSPYDGPLDVHSYAVAYAASLDQLAQIAAALSSPRRPATS
jgi:hypothetical protein